MHFLRHAGIAETEDTAHLGPGGGAGSAVASAALCLCGASRSHLSARSLSPASPYIKLCFHFKERTLRRTVKYEGADALSLLKLSSVRTQVCGGRRLLSLPALRQQLSEGQSGHLPVLLGDSDLLCAR